MAAAGTSGDLETIQVALEAVGKLTENSESNRLVAIAATAAHGYFNTLERLREKFGRAIVADADPAQLRQFLESIALSGSLERFEKVMQLYNLPQSFFPTLQINHPLKNHTDKEVISFLSWFTTKGSKISNLVLTAALKQMRPAIVSWILDQPAVVMPSLNSALSVFGTPAHSAIFDLFSAHPRFPPDYFRVASHGHGRYAHLIPAHDHSPAAIAYAVQKGWLSSDELKGMISDDFESAKTLLYLNNELGAQVGPRRVIHAAIKQDDAESLAAALIVFPQVSLSDILVDVLLGAAFKCLKKIHSIQVLTAQALTQAAVAAFYLPPSITLTLLRFCLAIGVGLERSFFLSLSLLPPIPGSYDAPLSPEMWRLICSRPARFGLDLPTLAEIKSNCLNAQSYEVNRVVSSLI